MELDYKSNKLKKQCEDPKVAQKKYGAIIENKLTQRVAELRAATSLLDIKNNPSARLHKLKGKRGNRYAVDLVHPFRLVFKPVLQKDRDIDKLESIKKVRIEEVIDYHGKEKK